MACRMACVKDSGHRGVYDFSVDVPAVTDFRSGCLYLAGSPMTEAQRKKRNFRGTKKWKCFRKKMKHVYGGVDYVTQKKLYKGWELHHMDLDETHYQDLSDIGHFMACNKKTHEFIHWAYEYYKNDRQFIKRFTDVLKKMKQINEE